MIGNGHPIHDGGGSAPAPPGFTAVAPEWLLSYGAAVAAPAIPAAESTLGFHPWRALSSAQVLPEWSNRNLAVDGFLSNGDNPLTSCLTPGVHFSCPQVPPRFPPGSPPRFPPGLDFEDGRCVWLPRAAVPRCVGAGGCEGNTRAVPRFPVRETRGSCPAGSQVPPGSSQRIVAYIEENPVSAGLAARPPEDWPWSSAGWGVL